MGREKKQFREVAGQAEFENHFVSDRLTLEQKLSEWAEREQAWVFQGDLVVLGGFAGRLTHAQLWDLVGIKALERLFLDFHPFNGILKHTPLTVQSLSLRSGELSSLFKRLRSIEKWLEEKMLSLQSRLTVDFSGADPLILMDDPHLEALVALARKRSRPLFLRDILDLFPQPDSELLSTFLPQWLEMSILRISST